MRVATVDDLILAYEALRKTKEKNPNRQMKWADEGAVWRYLKLARERGEVVVVDGFLILFSACTPWFSFEKFLVEDLILRISGDAPVERAIAALDILREQHGCVAIISGDTQVGYMAKKYTASGFTLLGSQFMKE